MKISDRHGYIMNKANSLGFVSKEDTARELGVSIETIRRDISALCMKKLLRRVKGGAMPLRAGVRKDDVYVNRVHQLKREREAIGYAAAALIKDGDVVALDSGTSIQPLAEAIMGVKNVTFVTDSLASALILYNKIDAGAISGRVIVIGGEMNIDRCTAGSMADDIVRSFHFDIAFISCTALSVNCVSSYNLDLCHYSKRIMKNASTNVLIAESEKVGKDSLYGFAELKDFDVLIIDDKHALPDEIGTMLEEGGVTLNVVKC